MIHRYELMHFCQCQLSARFGRAPMTILGRITEGVQLGRVLNGSSLRLVAPKRTLRRVRFQADTYLT